MSCLVAKTPKTQERGDLWMDHHPARVVCQCLIEKHFKPICSKIWSYNPFSDESKAMIREMGNVELFELCELHSKSAMFRMPSLLESRSDLLHLWTVLGSKRIHKKV